MSVADKTRVIRRVRWLIVLAGLLAYAAALGGDFVYDDGHSVRDNPALQSLANIPGFFVDVSLFSSLDCRLYRPVLLVSFAIDAFVGDMHPFVFKLSNLALHIGAALLLFGIACRLRTGVIAAGFAAVLFVAHPMASEAVNTISGRSNLMMVFFLLAGVRCYQSAMEGGRAALALAWLCGSLAVGCKEPGMILPVLFVILEGLRIAADPSARLDRRKIAVRLAPAVAIVIGYVFLRAHFLGAASFGVGNLAGTDVSSGHTRGLVTQIATMLVVLPTSLLQVLVPHGITMDPVVPYTSDLLSVRVLGGALVLLVLTALGLRSPRRRPALFLGTCLAWGTALPWVVKPLNLPFLEHRYYGVLAGLALVTAAMIRAVDWRSVTIPSRAACAAVVLVFAGMSGTRSLDFSTEENLWQVELARNPDSMVATAGLAVIRMQQERHAEARPLLEAVVTTYPKRRDARLNLAENALHLDDPSTALTHSRELIERWPQSPFHWLLHSRCLAAKGAQTGSDRDFDEAVAAARHCLTIAEPKGLVYRTAAAARRTQGDLPGALTLLNESVARGLDHETVLFDRSGIYEELGRYEEARRDLMRIRMRNPFHPRLPARLEALNTRARPR